MRFTGQTSATVISGLTVTNIGGTGFSIEGGTPVVQDVHFLGCHLDLRDSATIDRCVFTGISNFEAVFTRDGNPLLIQCLFFGNPASTHAVTRQTDSTGVAKLVNCTILSGLGAPVRVRDNSRVDMTNTNLDAAPSVSTTGGVLNAARCLYPGATGNNIDGSATFEDAGNDDYRLAHGSLGIDAADYNGFANAGGGTLDLDLGGSDRVFDDLCTTDTGSGTFTYLDIGAFEYQIVDSDNDGVGDGCDLCTGDDASGDVDGDGVCDEHLLLHWKLDESTGPNYREEVSGLSNAVEVETVTEGQPRLARDCGTAFGFTNTAPNYSYVEAGTLKSDGTYVAGSDPDYRVLTDFTIGIWFNWASGANTMWGSDWNASDGWSTRLQGGQIVHDFGSTPVSSGLMPQQGQDYFLAIVRRTSNVTDLPGTGEVSTDRHVFALYDKTAGTWSYSYGSQQKNMRLQGIAIGTFNTNGEWVGTLDDPRFYDIVLTQANLDALVTAPISDDADGDGVPDGCDACPGYDDAIDTDSDGVADGCDPCPFDNPDDADSDGICESADVCPGSDDTVDADSDGVPDGCDRCPGSDDAIDADGDGVPDGCDACPGSNDHADGDGDGVPDDCDVCSGFDDTLDADSDGVPDDCDACPGYDDAIDTDSDGVADGCDLCTGDDASGDADGDGVCDEHLLLHWKLDESTGPNYMEEVSGLSNAVEVETVTEGQPGLAQDGGTAFGFTNTAPNYSYVEAGTAQKRRHVRGGQRS